MTRSPLSATILGLLLALPGLGCSHSQPFGTGVDAVTVPFSAAPPVRLTYNAADNYWPSWTEDGRGIIYSYSYTQPDTHADDRCIGVLPATGGARVWQLCDERREHADSADSFAAAAIGTDGRLVYLEASSRRGPGGLSGVNPPPQTIVLWLADTALPFQRRALLQLGARISGQFVNWFRDTHWTGQASFVTLAQFADFKPRPNGALVDTIFFGVGIARGEILPTGATLSLVPGTAGATMYSVAENGASLVFVRSGPAIERVPAGGGSPTTATCHSWSS